MNLITITEDRLLEEYKKHWYLHLTAEMFLVRKYFDWLKVEIKGKVLTGTGVLQVGSKSYEVEVNYSPFFENRFDRILIKDESIMYNPKIHLYMDRSLCLYHPKIDKPLFKMVPLFHMIPWITEWCVYYEEWKKYGVWLGKEIQH